MAAHVFHKLQEGPSHPSHLATLICGTRKTASAPEDYNYFIKCFTGWWLSHPSEKYESQLGFLFPIYGKIKAPTGVSVLPFYAFVC